MQSHHHLAWHKAERTGEKTEAELRAEIEPLLMLPFCLVIIAWVLRLFGMW